MGPLGDVDIKGVLYGIAAALPFFRSQGAGHFINISSGHRVGQTLAVYSGTNFAVRALSRTCDMVLRLIHCTRISLCVRLDVETWTTHRNLCASNLVRICVSSLH
jgi:NADP-dependent 3-hydroxy acid dehydrogenase YdfG